MAETHASAVDEKVIALAKSEHRLLLTEVKDFGELVVRWRWPVPGLVLMRTETLRPGHKWARLSIAIDRFGERLFGRHTVVDDCVSVRGRLAGDRDLPCARVQQMVGLGAGRSSTASRSRLLRYAGIGTSPTSFGTL